MIIMTTTAMHHGHEHHAHETHGLKHYHDEDMQSVALTIEGEVDPEKFMPWLNTYIQSEGASILRSKGILAFKNEPQRFVFQGVHMILERRSPARMEAGRKAREPARLHRPQPEATTRSSAGFLACAA